MIALTSISRTFHVGDEEVRALRDVSLGIEDGEYLSIMGPSGSGKSTLLNIIGCLDRPTSGSYRLDDREVAELSERELAAVRRNTIGFVFQFFHLVPRLTAFENVELPLVFESMEPRDRRVRVERALEAVGLRERMGHRPDQLSGGERQRVAIARATISEPELLLADEPTGNLDSKSGAEIVDLIEDLNRRGITLIVVTHDPEIGRRARRRIRIADGRVASDERAEPEAG